MTKPLLITLTAIWCLAFASCSKNPEATSSASSTLVLNWKAEPEFGGLYEGIRAGLFQQRGIDLKIIGGPGASVIQMVATGNATFGIASADEVVIARSRGSDLVAIFATYQTNPQGLMTHASRRLTSIAEIFHSGTLAVEPGLPYVRFLEKKFGFANIRVVPYNYSIAPFLADKEMSQQCFVTAEPIAARRLGADPQVFLVADTGYNPYAAVVVTSGELVRRQPGLVRSVVEALRAGWQQYLTDPGPANSVMAKLNPEMNSDTFEAGADAQRKLIVNEAGSAALGEMIAARWAELGKQLAELKIIGKEPGAEECFVDQDTLPK